MDRNIERHRRRREINDKLKYANDYCQVVHMIYIMDAHLRTTCILDIEEFLYNKKNELINQNRWWQKFELSILMSMIKERGLH
tara:strand:+ start:422 stop:670 length:249 start_codon:yes stop_codon:yes gene_type:complete